MKMGRRRAEHVVIRHRHNGLFISVTIDNQRRNGEGLIGWPRLMPRAKRPVIIGGTGR